MGATDPRCDEMKPVPRLTQAPCLIRRNVRVPPPVHDQHAAASSAQTEALGTSTDPLRSWLRAAIPELHTTCAQAHDRAPHEGGCE